MGDRRGFTIVELLASLLLLSVVAAFSIPAYFARGEVTLENAAVLLARDLRAAQNRSAYMGEPSIFAFDVEGDGYRVHDEFGDVIRNPTTMQPFVRSYGFDGVFEGVEILEVDLGPDDSLVYDKRGIALEGGRIVLGFRGETRELLVDKSSGSVVVLGSTSGWNDDGH